MQGQNNLPGMRSLRSCCSCLLLLKTLFLSVIARSYFLHLQDSVTALGQLVKQGLLQTLWQGNTTRLPNCVLQRTQKPGPAGPASIRGLLKQSSWTPPSIYGIKIISVSEASLASLMHINASETLLLSKIIYNLQSPAAIESDKRLSQHDWRIVYDNSVHMFDMKGNENYSPQS